MRFRSHAAMMVLALLPTLMSGCSNYEGRVPVTGQVTIDGAPMNDGFIAFIGSEGYAVASGPIQNGQYSLSESAGRPGISAGDYTIRVESWKEKPGEELPKGGFSKGVSAIPEKYQDNTQSGLTAKVTEKDHHFDFELTSKL